MPLSQLFIRAAGAVALIHKTTKKIDHYSDTLGFANVAANTPSKKRRAFL